MTSKTNAATVTLNTCMKIFIFASIFLFSDAAFSQSSVSEPQHVLVRPEVQFDKCKKPQWPSRLAERGQEGVVQIAVMVGVDGKAIRTMVQHSSGFPALDTATEAALIECPFRPGTIDGEPVSMLMTTNHYWFNSPTGEPGEHWRKVLRLAQDGEVPALYAVALWLTSDTDRISDGIKLLKTLADAGYPLAQYEVGVRYEAGNGLTKDMKQAEIWYAKAAAQGELLSVERARLIQESGIH